MTRRDLRSRQAAATTWWAEEYARWDDELSPWGDVILTAICWLMMVNIVVWTLVFDAGSHLEAKVAGVCIVGLVAVIWCLVLHLERERRIKRLVDELVGHEREQ